MGIIYSPYLDCCWAFLVFYRYRLQLEMAASQQRRHADKFPGWKVFAGEVAAVGGVKFVVQRQVCARDLDVDQWGEPLRWHKLFGHSFRFPKGVLASPSRRRGLGKGTALESPSPAV